MSSIYKQPKSRFWWIKFRDADGVVRRKSLRTPNKGIAREMQKVIDQGLRTSAKTALTLDGHRQAFLDNYKPTVNQRQYLTLSSRLTCAMGLLDVADATDLTHDHIQGMITSLTDKGRAARTIRAYVTAVSLLCRYLIERSG